MERMNLFWEELDRELENLRDDRPVYSSASLPYRLRKQRSLVPTRLSLLGSSDSLGVISETGKLRKVASKLFKTHRSSTPDLKKLLQTPSSNATAVDTEPLDLPSGVKQIGSGIGFTRSVPASSRISKVSLQSILKPSASINTSGQMDGRSSAKLTKRGSRLSILAHKMAHITKPKASATSGVIVARTSTTVEDAVEHYERTQSRMSATPVLVIGNASPALTGEEGGPTMRLVPAASKPIGLGTQLSFSDV